MYEGSRRKSGASSAISTMLVKLTSPSYEFFE